MNKLHLDKPARFGFAMHLLRYGIGLDKNPYVGYKLFHDDGDVEVPMIGYVLGKD